VPGVKRRLELTAGSKIGPFRACVLKVENATADEIAHSHVH
jgi:hypothetical protein